MTRPIKFLLKERMRTESSKDQDAIHSYQCKNINLSPVSRNNRSKVVFKGLRSTSVPIPWKNDHLTPWKTEFDDFTF